QLPRLHRGPARARFKGRVPGGRDPAPSDSRWADFALRGGRRDELHKAGAVARPRRVSKRDQKERLGHAPSAKPAARSEVPAARSKVPRRLKKERAALVTGCGAGPKLRSLSHMTVAEL